MVQAEVVLASEQRVGALVLEGDLEHFAAEGRRVRCLHTLPGGGKGVSGDGGDVTRGRAAGWGWGVAGLLTLARKRRAWCR